MSNGNDSDYKDISNVENDFIDKLTGEIIALALKEDKVNEDITTNSLLDCDSKVKAEVTAKENGIISGTDIFTRVFREISPDISINIHKPDGSTVGKGDLVITVEGMESDILKAERTALNFLQRLSGIATLTNQFVQELGDSNIHLLDTRKTTPGMRYLEKRAVKDGGGANHRMNLEDMAMVKDNHIKMAGSITNAVNRIRNKFPGKKIEVEVKNLEELREAVQIKADIVMLDNFNPEFLKEAVKIANKQVKLEISGNVNLENIAKKASAGVGIDFISVGALTHSFKSLDLSLNIYVPHSLTGIR